MVPSLALLAKSVVVVGVMIVAGCATTQPNHYRAALTAQERCCQGLGNPSARQACMADIPRTQDEMSPINRETFQCVERHFQCEAATGKATRPSAQMQLDCINDLESTQQARNESPVAPTK